MGYKVKTTNDAAKNFARKKNARYESAKRMQAVMQ